LEFSTTPACSGESNSLEETIMRLTDQQLTSELNKLQNWQQIESAIQKNFQFKDFLGAMKFVNNVADIAEQMNHHPDISISYNKVVLSLSSHDSGGVTSRDIKLATRIDALAHERAA
jgi:4a-hydroxytetrahydrobiopterin dehydratase